MLLMCCRAEYDHELLSHALSLCPHWRRQKAEGISNEKSRALSITAGLLLRHALCLFGDDIENCEAEADKNGKPFLKNSDVLFSLSHSGDYAACAVSKRAVGVDIQRVTDISERVLQRFCTDNELRAIKQSRNPQLMAVKIWSLKESYLKASEKSTSQVFKTEFVFDEKRSDFNLNGFSFFMSEEISGYVLTACERQ